MTSGRPPGEATSRRSTPSARRRRQDPHRLPAAVLDALPTPIALLDSQGTIVAVNVAWRQFVAAHPGPEPPCAVGKNCLEICQAGKGICAAEAPTVLAGLRSLLRGEAPELTLDYPVSTPQSQRWYRLTARPLAAEPSAGLVVMHVDVTEMRLATEHLRASELRLRSILQSEPECVKTVSLDGRLLAMNPAGLRLLEARNEAAVVGRQVCDFIHPEDRAAYLEAHQKAAEGETVQLQFRLIGLAGTERWMESQSVPLRADDGSVSSVLSVTRDFSERKRTEAALRESEDRYRDLVENSHDLMCTQDLEGNLLSVNEAAVLNTGYSRAALLQMNAADLLAPEERSRFAEFLQVLRDQGRASGLVRIRTAGGETRYWEYSNTLRTKGVSSPVIRGTARDVTTARRAKEELRASEARYRTLIQSMGEGLIMVDDSDVIRFVNPQICRMLGYSEEEMLGQNAAALLLRKEDQAAMAERNRRRSSGIAEGYEVEQRRKSGEFVWTRFSATPVVDADGRVTGSMAIVADITERKRAEEAKRASEAQLRRIVDNIHDALYVDGADGKVTFANDQFLALFGIERAQLPHLELEDYIAPEWRAMLRDRHERRLRGEAVPTQFEYEGLGQDGRRLWLESTVVPLLDGTGSVIGTLAADRDITERKRAEESILKEKAFTEAMLDSLPGIFYLIDPAGRLLRWNRALEKTFGYTSAEVASMQTLDFVAIEDRPRIEESLRKVFTTGAADAEAELVTKNGKRAPYFLTGLRFVVEGKPCCIGTGIDLSARKLLEAELQQAQKIEAIGRLAGGVAHDFNNILGVILGYGELAESELAPGSSVREPVREMVKAAQRAATLTRQLQAFSRKQILQPKSLDLNALVANAHTMLGRLIGEDISLVLRPAPDLGTVRADPGQIDQILLNLAVNARDAMPGGGTLTLETANVDLHEEYVAAHVPAKPGRYVMVAVSDTGAGMDAETQRRVFEPFFTTKPEGQGTGLGLSTVYGIVKQSGGYIWIYSEPGIGTTIKIYFPRVEQVPEGDAAGAPLESTSEGGETILLVEDNPALREMIRRRLEGCGYKVLLAGDGEEALALAAAGSEPVDLLLTDVVMPNLGGAELASRMSALRPGLRVLFMSGYTDGAIAQHGVLAEGVALLEKPFSGEQLLRAVRVALDRPGANGFRSESFLRP